MILDVLATLASQTMVTLYISAQYPLIVRGFAATEVFDECLHMLVTIDTWITVLVAGYPKTDPS